MLNAKNGRLTLPGGGMDYIRFGRGGRALVMIPGVGDGLKTVKGMALPFAMMYRALARDFTVYVFSRRIDLAPGTTTRDMAGDLDAAMEALGLSGAAVVGVSQGGMIAQWLAIDHPERVGRLVLTVTLSRPNPTIKAVIGRWLDMARRGDYRGIMLDTAEKSYSERRIRQARRMYGLLGEGALRSDGEFRKTRFLRTLHDPGGILSDPRRLWTVVPHRLSCAGDRWDGGPDRHRGGVRRNGGGDPRQSIVYVRGARPRPVRGGPGLP